MSVHVTVGVCTWNRAALLDQTLTRMRELRLPAGATWELLVVNNNSTDDTDAVIENHAAAVPIRRLFEPMPGHSNARNRAIEHARGDLLVWTDDDVLVDPDWIAEYLKAAERFPEAGYFGGTVDPWFETDPPRWVVRNLALIPGPFAVRQLGPEVRPLAEKEQVFGANMAFRTDLLKQFRFNPELGRKGTGMLSGDETDLIDRIKATGRSGVWVGPARVRHYIPADRLTAAYVWRFFHGLGRTNQRLAPHDRGVSRFLGAPRWVIRLYLAERLKSLVLAPWGGPAWVRSFTRAAAWRGIIDECRSARLAAPPVPAGS
jgi:glycosyltransferase involved in cell wall biosynthesis